MTDSKYHDTPYIELVSDVLQNGVRKENRTGMDTFAVFSRQMRFDLSDGTIPLLTTKKMHTRSIIYELLWYLQGNTSSEELERNGVRIWKEWKADNGELGKIYGHMWRNWEPRQNSITFVERRIVDPTSVIFTPVTFLQEQPNQPNSDPFVGTIHCTKECGKLQVLDLNERDEKYKDHKYTIQFFQTGYKKYNVRKSVIKRGHIIDRYLPRVNGVGYLGEYDENDLNIKQLKCHWYKILDRCYNSTTAEYSLYGGAGVFVHPRWHNFANFQQDVKYIPNWNNKRLNPSSYELDKDYYQSNCYSKDTCVWLTSKHNTLYRTNPNPFEIITPDGNRLFRLSVPDVCTEFGLTNTLVYGVLNKKRNHHKNFYFNYISPPEGKVARYTLPTDQIANVINILRSDPNSRRLIISAWDPTLLPDTSKTFNENVTNDKQALPPCHYAFQFYTEPLSSEESNNSNGSKYKLSLMLNQRSCDVFLGVPFNIVQYSILLHMVAQVVNMVPGEFIWNGGDVHLYENHIDQAKTQISRYPYPSPLLKLNSDIREIDDFTFEDFEIVNYQHHALIKAEVSV